MKAFWTNMCQWNTSCLFPEEPFLPFKDHLYGFLPGHLGYVLPHMLDPVGLVGLLASHSAGSVAALIFILAPVTPTVKHAIANFHHPTPQKKQTKDRQKRLTQTVKPRGPQFCFFRLPGLRLREFQGDLHVQTLNLFQLAFTSAHSSRSQRTPPSLEGGTTDTAGVSSSKADSR